MDFDTAIVNHFKTHPDLDRARPQLYRIVMEPTSPRRTRQIARMEEEARLKLALGNSSVDWSLPDWNWLLILQFIGAILGIILLIV